MQYEDALTALFSITLIAVCTIFSCTIFKIKDDNLNLSDVGVILFMSTFFSMLTMLILHILASILTYVHITWG